MARKTGRKCHVCGGPLGTKWHADHVRAYHLGGGCAEDNFLPACRTCNRLRWHNDSHRIRKMLRLGVYILKEIENGTELGKLAKGKYHARLQLARGRRV